MKTKQNTYYFLLLLVGMLLCSESFYAQQESQYTQYTYNTMSINPAYTGGRGRLSVLALYRNQWVGIDGAPETFNISGHTPLGQTGRVGVGAEFTADKIGPTTSNIAAGNFSYVIPFSAEFQFSFGIKAGVIDFNLDPDKLNIYDQHGLDLRNTNRMMPILGIGTYFYGKNWYVGVSTPNFLETKYFDETKVSTAKQKMHLYLITGYLLNISDEVALKPSALVKSVQGAPLALDISLNSIFYDRFNLGIAYRTSAAFNFMTGFQLNDHFMVGYAFDYSTSELAKYNSGSHEIFLRFELAPLRYRSIRRGTGPSF
ncbi:MAG TPA: type IX secretion system membrane protein PorP/SprF [Flavobacteriaceae bacterium]|nr:type IX secretion system membrane protein PorP/SprF [Flavobacteriaceae bacterium]